MADDDDSIDSDDWGAEELVIPPVGTKDNNTSNGNDDNDLGDDYWKVENKKPVVQDSIKEPAADESKQQASSSSSSSSMIIVDITQMDPNIHSKFDRNSVNQPEQASALRKKIEQNYKEYAFSNTLLSEGTVIPCGSSVWRDALVTLRDDRKGHYFVPIFAPKNSAS